MLSPARVPLAWKNLTHRPIRFLVYLAGLAFAVLLMFVQLGFWCALLDSVVGLIERMNADLVIINKAKYYLAINEPFPLRRLEQVRSLDGVDRVTPLYLGLGVWKTPEKAAPFDPFATPLPSRQLIRVIAYDLHSSALAIPEVQGFARALQETGTVLIDSQSKPEFHIQPPVFQTELNDQTISVLGTFKLGTDFATNGSLIMSEQSYAQLFSGSSLQPLEEVEAGLVQLTAAADGHAIQQALQRILPDDVMVLTREQYADKEKRYWQTSTPMGFIFFLGLIVGFVVGVIICSQILSSDVTDHLSEYATLKAIGYTNLSLTAVILQEALILSLLAFLPGVLLSKGMYLLLESWTGLPLYLTLPRGAAVLLFTVLMCMISGLLAGAKVWVLDPAEVF